MLNPYHNHYQAENEHSLTDQLIIEAIQMKGVNLRYLPREHNDYNFLYGEDPTSSFGRAVEIEAYLVNVNGFGGEGELMSKFGLEIRDTAEFIVNKTRWTQEFPDMPRPKEGDLLFMPITNAILEIKYVNHESPFFQHGKQFVFELKCETFEFSHEQIVSGDDEIDDIVASITNFDPRTETEEYGDNDEIDYELRRQTTFDPSNPFGVD